MNDVKTLVIVILSIITALQLVVWVGLLFSPRYAGGFYTKGEAIVWLLLSLVPGLSPIVGLIKRFSDI